MKERHPIKDDIDGCLDIVRNDFYEFNDTERDFACNLRVLKLRNDIIEHLQEFKKHL